MNQQLQGAPYCTECGIWLETASRGDVITHEHHYHDGAQTVWSLLPCGCPEQEVQDIGHQEGCRERDLHELEPDPEENPMNPTDRATVYRTARDDYPTLVCSCGVSLLDYPGYAGRLSSRAAHEADWHSPEIPASYRSVTGGQA